MKRIKGVLPIRKLNESLVENYEIGETVGEKINTNFKDKNMAWIGNGNVFLPSEIPNTNSIPAGLYNVGYDFNNGSYLERQNIKIDNVFEVPDPVVMDLRNDIYKYWNSVDKYRSYGIVPKRGYLLHGAPGNGKTTIINMVISDVVKNYDGIAINVSSIDEFIPMVTGVRNIEGDRPILAIIEDMDGFLQHNNVKEFLNLLDGNRQIDNVVYLATTNYIDVIPPRIKNRPSRFDIVLEIPSPNEQVREYYFKNKLKPEDIEKFNIDKWVKDSEGFTFSHLKEMLIAIAVMDQDYGQVIDRLKQLNDIEPLNIEYKIM
jgi:hypothetical protein